MSRISFFEVLELWGGRLNNFIIICILFASIYGCATQAPAEWVALNPDNVALKKIAKSSQIKINSINRDSKFKIGQRIALPQNQKLANSKDTGTGAGTGNSKDLSARYNYSNNSKIAWQWPVQGKVVTRTYAENNKNYGIDILGKNGLAIKAAAAGRVLYCGNSLRGYGNLLIIKHSDLYLTAYAHAHRILVKEGDDIKAGQVIANMGKTGTDAHKLHFQIRYNGNPVDPLRYLP